MASQLDSGGHLTPLPRASRTPSPGPPDPPPRPPGDHFLASRGHFLALRGPPSWPGRGPPSQTPSGTPSWDPLPGPPPGTPSKPRFSGRISGWETPKKGKMGTFPGKSTFWHFFGHFSKNRRKSGPPRRPGSRFKPKNAKISTFFRKSALFGVPGTLGGVAT